MSCTLPPHFRPTAHLLLVYRAHLDFCQVKIFVTDISVYMTRQINSITLIDIWMIFWLWTIQILVIILKNIYPKELKLVKSNSDSCHTPFLDLDITIENGLLITRIYDKRDDFDFPIVNFPFLDGDIPFTSSYGIYISQLVRFRRSCTKVSDFKRNLSLTEKLLKKGY